MNYSSLTKCGCESIRMHGTYERKVQDLPILGKRTYLLVNAYEYYCDNPECETTTFAENINGFLSYYSRMTDRLEDFICILALDTSCESCARIMKSMGVKVSGDTVIRILLKRYSGQEVSKCGSTVKIDDFAFKKRDTYGTIIVDKATHKPVAVIKSRDVESLKEGLSQNKHVTTVTRDRASAYAKAVEEILPDCIQIADRFHLHQNLLEAVNKVLGREIPTISTIPKESDIVSEAESAQMFTSQTNEGKKTELITDNLTASEEKRRQLIFQIQELHQNGISIREIARITGKERKTVKKYLDGNPDKLCRSNKHGSLDGYKDSIIKSVQCGMTQSAIIRQLKEKGYMGSASNIRQYISSMAAQCGLELAKYRDVTTKYDATGKPQSKVDYITRKGIFNYLWMEGKLE